VALVLVALVLAQSGKEKSLSGTISAAPNPFWKKQGQGERQIFKQDHYRTLFLSLSSPS
jgi:preprotein translocase subunit SecG